MDNYKLGKVIGKGSYGEVKLARHLTDSKQYVIKSIDLHNASKKERRFAQQEVDILSKLRHPNIVSYKESFQTSGGCLAIVMGYCEGGDLYTRLKEQAKVGKYLQEEQVVEWFVQIAMALQYMHDRNILHRDLKTQNIFLSKSKIIKLGDLGIARVLESNVDMATTMIGTPYYMSPELFSNQPYNYKSDMWALGCCVYEMTTLKHAFNAKDMNSLVYKILKGKPPEMPQQYSTDLCDIMKVMLNQAPSQRPSAARLLRLPFIKKHIALFLEGTKNRRKSRDSRRKRTASLSQMPNEEDENNYIATISKVDVQVKNDPSSCDNNIPDQANKVQLKEQEVENNNIIATNYQPEKDNNKIEQPNIEKDIRISEENQKEEESPASEMKRVLNSKVQNRVRQKQRHLEERRKEEDDQVVNSPKRKERRERSRPLPPPPPTCSDAPRPRLPPPRFKSVTSAKTDESNVKCTPNMEARKKRRQRQQSDSIVYSSVVKRISSSLEPTDSVDAPAPRASRLHRVEAQDDLTSDYCTGEESCSPSSDSLIVQTSLDDSGDERKSSEVRGEVASLIHSLQRTLKMNSSDDSQTSPQQSLPPDDVCPTVSGRLLQRINKLRRECLTVISEESLSKAYLLIDTKPEDQLQSALVKLFGEEKYETISAQVWQLKFLEEFVP